MKQAERICGRSYFCFWWICTSIIALLAFLGALNLCKAITVRVHLVLNKAPSQQLREGRRSFPSNSILVCISSTSTLYLFLHFLPQAQLSWNKLQINSQFEKYQRRPFVYYQGMCESVRWWSFMQRLKRVSHRQILNVTSSFFATDMSDVKCTDCDDLFGIYIAVVPRVIDQIKAL